MLERLNNQKEDDNVLHEMRKQVIHALITGKIHGKRRLGVGETIICIRLLKITVENTIWTELDKDRTQQRTS
jgi:hypothetical protein